MPARPMMMVGALFAGLMFSSGTDAEAARVTTYLNLRIGPGVGYAPITVIPGGGWVEVIGYSGGWCRVEWAGYRGWVSCRYLADLAPPGGYYYPEPDDGVFFEFFLAPRIFERERHDVPRKPRRPHYRSDREEGRDRAYEWHGRSGDGEKRWPRDDGRGDWPEH